MKILKKILIVVSTTIIFSSWILSSSNAFECNIPILESSSDAVKAYYIPENKFAGQFINVPKENVENEIDKACREKFEELSGAKVNMIVFPKQKDMLDAINLALATKSGEFDAMTSGAGGAKEYGLGGHLNPLPQPPDLDDFYTGDINQYSIGGELMGIPSIADTNILYWRTDLFEEAGLDPTKPPKTYTELTEYAKLLTIDKNGKNSTEEGFDKNNIEIYGFGFKGEASLASPWEWYNYLFAFGGDLFDSEYNISIDSPESIASLQWVVDNYRVHNIMPADTPVYDYGAFHTLFIQGKMAMAVNWPYMYGMSQDPEQSNVVGKVAVGRKPMEVRHAGNMGGWSWSVLKMSKKQELASAYAKWNGNPDLASYQALIRGNAPARISITELMVKEKPIIAGAIAKNLPDTMGVKWLDAGPSWMSLEKETWKFIQYALTGVKTPEQAVKDAKVEMEKILKRDRFYEEIVPQLLVN